MCADLQSFVHYFLLDVNSDGYWDIDEIEGLYAKEVGPLFFLSVFANFRIVLLNIVCDG